ncbi:MAG: metal ABC transporter permease [Bdellovibrionales bacterium]
MDTSTERFELLFSQFMLMPFIAALLAGWLCGLIGPLFVWRRLAVFSSTISHAALTPIAVAQALQMPQSILLLPFSSLLSILLVKLEEKGSLELDSILSIFFAGFMGLGILIMTLTGLGSIDAVHFLFGDILLVTREDVMTLAVITLVTSSYVLYYRRDILLLSLHKDIATVSGVATQKHIYILTVLCGLTVTVLLSVMGIILATSLLIVPPLIAARLSRSLKSYSLWSIGLGITLTLCGLIISFMIDAPSGPAISVLGMILYGFTFLLKKAH